MTILRARIPKELVEELEQRFPQKCIHPMDSMADAHHYAGEVHLVEFLRKQYEEQQKAELW